jgi:hypothetical protein
VQIAGSLKKNPDPGKDVPLTVWAPVYVYFKEKGAMNQKKVILTNRLTLECCLHLSFLKDLFGKSRLLKVYLSVIIYQLSFELPIRNNVMQAFSTVLIKL